MSKSAAKKNTQQDLFLKETYKKDQECWNSNLFHEVFLRNDMQHYFKEFEYTHENNSYDNFLEEFKSLCTRVNGYKFTSEDDTVEKFIIPVMKCLGWVSEDPKSPLTKRNYATKLNITSDTGENGELDLYFTDEIFEQPEIEKYRGKSNNKAYHAAKELTIFNVEAKAWGKLTRFKVGNEYDLSEEEIEEIRGSALTPPEQACKYMQMTEHDFTILTDGNTWQLLNKDESIENAKRCYEFDLGKLKGFISQLFDEESSAFVNWDFIEDQARYFYYLFSKDSLFAKKGTTPIQKMLKESSKYSKTIQDNLKVKFLESMNIICNSYGQSFHADGNDLNDKKNRDLIRGAGENFLFTLLFIKSLEARTIINPYIPEYENEYSLTYVINSIDPRVSGYNPESSDEFNESKLRRDVFIRDHGFKSEFSYDGFELYERILKLIDIVEKGKFGFSIDTFTKSIFSTKEKKILKKVKINNKDMVNIVFNLGFTKNDSSKNNHNVYSQIPYDYFSPRELGSIYESFLEFQLEYADQATFFNTSKKQWQDIEGSIKDFAKKNNISESKIIKKGDLYFRPDNKDRKMSGSYYTPDYIVRHMVESTIGPFCDTRNSNEILNLKICDPSMGSAHFLIDALVYTTNRFRNALIQEKSLNEDYSQSLSKVLGNCIYGIDINKSAVKLAKISIWLTTAYSGKKLSTLDTQLSIGDSLFDTLDNIPMCDVLIGNPPFIAHQNMKREYKDLVEKNYPSVIDPSEQYDLCIAFFKKCFDIVKDNGAVSLIAPNQISYRPYGKKFREYIWTNHQIEKIIDLSEIKVFDDAATSPFIYMFKKGSPSKRAYTFCTNLRKVIDIPNAFSSKVTITGITKNYPFQEYFASSYIEDQATIFSSLKTGNLITLGDIAKKPSRGNIGSTDKSGSDTKKIKIVKSKFLNNKPQYQTLSVKNTDFDKYMKKYGQQKIVMPRYFQSKFISSIESKAIGVGSNVYYLLKEDLSSKEISLEKINIVLNSHIFSIIDYLYSGADRINEFGFRALDGRKFCNMRIPKIEHITTLSADNGFINYDPTLINFIEDKDSKQLLEGELFIAELYGIDIKKPAMKKLLTWWKKRLDELSLSCEKIAR